jgi:heptose-I-phosphate ethanolaminephosphotransferase
LMVDGFAPLAPTERSSVDVDHCSIEFNQLSYFRKSPSQPLTCIPSKELQVACPCRDKMTQMRPLREFLKTHFALLVYFLILISPSFIYYLYHRQITPFLPFVVLFQLSVLLLLAGLLRYRIVIFCLTLVFYVTAVIHWGYYLIFRGEITTGALAAVLFTNPFEVRDFIGGLPWYTFLVLPFLLGIPAILFKFCPRTIGLKKLEVAALVLSFAICSFLKVWHMGSFQAAVADLHLNTQPLKTVISFTRAYRLIREYQDRLVDHKVLDLPFALSRGQLREETHVLVIGETARRRNWELYGYPRRTNQFLKDSGQPLVIFRDVISAANATILSLSYTLAFADESGKATILDMARKGGYETYWLSNQYRFGIWDNPTSVIASRATRQIFVSSPVAGPGFDEKILPELRKVLKNNEPRKLIVIHIMGSHLDYKRRYPESFTRFEGEAPAVGGYQVVNHKLVNEYDTSILYTDCILTQIIEEVARSGVAASVTYFSDHGETLYEKDGYVGHGGLDMRRCEVEVPFVVWLSERFRRDEPILLGRIESAALRPISLVDFFPSYLELLGIEVKVSSQGSFLRPDYRVKRRLVYDPNIRPVDYEELP